MKIIENIKKIGKKIKDLLKKFFKRDNNNYQEDNDLETVNQIIQLNKENQEQSQDQQSQGQQTSSPQNGDNDIEGPNQEGQPSDDKQEQSQEQQPSEGEQGQTQDKQPSEGEQGQTQDKQPSDDKQEQSQEQQPSEGEQGQDQEQQPSEGEQGQGQEQQAGEGEQGQEQDQQASENKQGQAQDQQQGDQQSQDKQTSSSQSEDNDIEGTKQDGQPSDDMQEQSQDQQPNEGKQEENQDQQQGNQQNEGNDIEDYNQEEQSGQANNNSDDLFERLNNNFERKKKLEEQLKKATNSEEKVIDDKIIEGILRKLIQEDPFEKAYGHQRIDKKKLAKHISLDLPHKILDDTYSPSQKPISFYFDFSESNDNSIFMYAKILTKLMKKDVSLYLGYNDLVCKKIQVKRNNIKRTDITHLLTIEKDEDAYIPLGYNVDFYTDSIKIDELIIKDKIEKIVIFSDYDAGDSIVEAAKNSTVIWLCTERKNRGNYFVDLNDHPSNSHRLKDFKGNFINLDEPKKLLEFLNNYGRYEYERKNRRQQLGER